MMETLADSTASTTDSADYASLDPAELRLGVRLHLPIHDERMVLLLSEGQIINESFLDKIRERGLSSVRVHTSELPRIHAGKPQGSSRDVPDALRPPACPERNAITDEFDEWLMNPAEVGLPPQGEAFAQGIVKQEAKSYDESLKQEYIERQEATVAQIDAAFEKLLAGQGLDLDGLSCIADEALADLQSERDLFVSLGVNPHSSGYPARHSLHTSMLAIAIGSQLKLDRATLKELAVGCLIHDSGMLMIDQQVALAPRKLRPSELLEISKHPVRIFDKMMGTQGIARRSAYIAYQMHERPDGTGYPRQRKNDQIHFLSRVAAVADVYVALAAPRPHRPGILPHAAIQAITQAASDGRFDPAAVQALLRTLSMYPLGSYVQLSDGRVGQVIRSNDMEFERPVVEAWLRGALNLPSDVVDLAVEQGVKILGPLASLNASLENPEEDAAAMRGLITRLDARSEQSAPAPATPQKSFQTYAHLYIPLPGSTPQSMLWKQYTGVSRTLSIEGMSLVTREEVRSPLLLVAFSPRAGTRLCLKALVSRHEPLQDGAWQIDLTFRGPAVEPNSVTSLGKL